MVLVRTVRPSFGYAGIVDSTDKINVDQRTVTKAWIPYLDVLGEQLVLH